MGLMGEEQSRDAGHRQGIGEAGQDRQTDDHDQGGTELGEHGGISSRETDGRDGQVDQLDADEGHDDAAEPVDQEVAAQEARRR